MKFNEITIGGVDCIEVPGDSDLGTIVLLHGYGSTNADLAPLSRVCAGPRWIFPRGFDKIVFGPDYTGYGWFPVDVMKIREAAQRNQFDEIDKRLAPDLTKASKKLSLFLDELETSHDKLVLGGFSQGAVVAVETALTFSDQIKALVILSGTVVHEAEWKALCSKHQGLRFFMSHGKNDDVLPYPLAEKLEKLLITGGLKGKMITFNGGHEVPFSLLLDLQPFLNNAISKK